MSERKVIVKKAYIAIVPGHKILSSILSSILDSILDSILYPPILLVNTFLGCVPVP